MKVGIIEVIYGPMFAGKTSELIRQMELSIISKFEVLVFKPKVDNRYKADEVCTNTDRSVHSQVVEKSREILNYIKFSSRKIDKIFIDEAQFFDEEIVKVINHISKNLGIDVTLAGLAQDFRGEPFGQMPGLLAIAQKTTSLTAICVMDMGNGCVCRKQAYFTQRLVNGRPASFFSPIILVGGADSYTARCEDHWEVLDRPTESLE